MPGHDDVFADDISGFRAAPRGPGAFPGGPAVQLWLFRNRAQAAEHTMRERRAVSRTKARVNGQTNGHSTQAVGIDDLTGVWNRAGFIAAANPM